MMCGYMYTQWDGVNLFDSSVARGIRLESSSTILKNRLHHDEGSGSSMTLGKAKDEVRFYE